MDDPAGHWEESPGSLRPWGTGESQPELESHDNAGDSAPHSFAEAQYGNGDESQSQFSGPFWSVGLQVPEEIEPVYNGWSPADLGTIYAYSLLHEHGNTMQPQDTLSSFAGFQNYQFPFQLDDFVHGESHPNSLAIEGGLNDSQDHFAGLTSYAPGSQMLPVPSDQYESLHSHQAHRGAITRPVNTGTNPSQTLLDQKSFYLDSLKNFDDILSSYYHRKQLTRMEGQTPGIIAFLDFPMYNSENKLTAIRFGTKCLHMRITTTRRIGRPSVDPARQASAKERLRQKGRHAKQLNSL
jgi:hypothetical protein